MSAELLRALTSKDKGVSERAARALRELARADAAALNGLGRELLQAAMAAEDLRVRWNLIIALGCLPLKGREKAVAVDWLFEWLNDTSGLTRTMALQALWNFSANDARLRARVRPRVQEALQNGTAAMQARARKLLKKPR